VTLGATHQNFTFDLTGFGTVGLINLVQDQLGATSYTVETKGLAYIPVVNGAPYIPDLLTSLEGFYPLVSAGGRNAVAGQPDAIMNFTQLSSSEFEYDYDLSPSSSSFTFASVSPGFFDDSKVFQGFPMDLSLENNYIFAARGSEGGRVKIEFTDVNHVKATFEILLSSVYQNYTLNLNSVQVPALFDKTQIAEIVFVQDRTMGSPLLNDFVKVQAKGIYYLPSPPTYEVIQTTLVTEGLKYFKTGTGIDPATHFPYDNQSSSGTFAHFTQPTLIGFYLQILGDVVKGNLSNGMSTTEALAEINAVLTSLRNLQTNNATNWNGLIPWMNLDTGTPILDYPSGHVSFGLLDNANMAQSIAVMEGALLSAGISATDPILVKAEQFLTAQTSGYQAFVDPLYGVFHMSYDRDAAQFSSYVDRLNSEVRGAVAFIQVRYPGISRTVWDNLEIKTANYTDRNGTVIENVMSWDGAAFQSFWPMLRNDEMSFIGFRNMLYNQLVSQLDWAAQNNLPGIPSASALPEGGYSGATGVPSLAEQMLNPSHLANYYDTVVMNVGSTYALASALPIDRNAVLGWLDAYNYVPGLNGTYGFFDSARSASEMAREYIGIDVASAILGLGGQGAVDFQAYLRKYTLESAYNLLYDAASKRLVEITKTTAGFSNAPEVPDRSLAVFSHVESEGTDGSFPGIYPNGGTTGVYGVQFKSSVALAGGWGGHYWKLKDAYNAQANQLVIYYTTVDTPQAIRIEFKDASGALLDAVTQTLANGVRVGRLVINLKNAAILNAVKEVHIIVDQNATGDKSFDFTIHSLTFQHFVSSPSPLVAAAGMVATKLAVAPAMTTAVLSVGSSETSGSSTLAASLSGQSETEQTTGSSSGSENFPVLEAQSSVDASSPPVTAALVLTPQLTTLSSTIQDLVPMSTGMTSAVTILPGNGVAQVVGSSANSRMRRFAKNVFGLHFDVATANAYARLVFQFDPNTKGKSIDLSKKEKIVFEIDSDKAKSVIFEIEDTKGKRAAFKVDNVDVSKNYYKFLTSLAAKKVDLKHIQKISFTVDPSSVTAGDEVGDLRVQIGGLQ